MQSLEAAIKKCVRKANFGNYPETMFVVYSKDEFDIPGNNYHVCSEYDLDTFYCHDEVVYCSDEYNG